MKKITYTQLNGLSIFLIFMLFVLGGLVRSTGSGMGCPDWPKCFGEYIPPLSADELPPDYEEYFQEQRITKNERFVSLLELVGLHKKAEAIRNNAQVTESHQFNAIKAYVEYINRLWGALTGIVVFLCLLGSVGYYRKKKPVFWYTLAGFVFVMANALLGAVVVHSNLIGGIVTLHFIAAFASVGFFILARHYAISPANTYHDIRTKQIGVVLLVLTAVQVILGAEVRELYDLLPPLGNIAYKIDRIYPTFQWHAVFGAIVLVVSIYQFLTAQKKPNTEKLYRWILFMCVAQLVWGPLALHPPTASISKLFHISMGAAIFIIQFYICTSFLAVNKNQK